MLTLSEIRKDNDGIRFIFEDDNRSTVSVLYETNITLDQFVELSKSMNNPLVEEYKVVPHDNNGAELLYADGILYFSIAKHETVDGHRVVIMQLAIPKYCCIDVINDTIKNWGIIGSKNKD